VTKPRLAAWLPACLWALSMSLWAAGMLLWLASASRHMPTRAGPVAASIVSIEPRQVAEGAGLEVAFSTVFLAVATVGALIAARQPQTAIGWILGSAGVVAGFRLFADGYAALSAGTMLGRLPADAAGLVWVSSWLQYASVGSLSLVLLLSPRGRLPSRRWRPVLWLQVGSLGLAMLSAAVAPGPLSGWPYMDNPLGITRLDGVPARLFQLSAAGVAAGLILATVSLVLRTRVASGEERQQVKWVLYGAAFVAVAFPGVAISTVMPDVATAWREARLLLFLAAFVLFVASLGVGVLRYHLYDIDFVISRTLVYGTLAAGITAVYAGLVAGVGSIVGSMGDADPATVPTEILALSLVAAALVAVVFQPVRERLQRLANRLVYGRRLSPYDVLADLSRRMAGALSVDAVLPRLAEAAAVGIGARRARVRVYVPGGRDQAVAWPAEALAETFERTTPVLHQGELVGEIAVSKPAGEPLTSTEQALLADLAAQAGPALGNVRLAADLRIQADELRASRQRIVAAQDQERRRIERDLHDGAQQHLVAMAVNLQIIQDLIEADPREAGLLVSEVRSEVAEALGTLRDLARGIYPPALADHGLRAALEGHIAKTIPIAHLESAAAADWRYAPDVEAAAYFCVLEALQNCAKHAPQTSVHVRLGAEAEWLTFEVTDEGPGFEPAHIRSGTGLQGMTDRLAAVGGSLAIRSSTGHGTTVAGKLPIGHRRAPSPA
jgi:signal transduction histidine kinase